MCFIMQWGGDNFSSFPLCHTKIMVSVNGYILIGFPYNHSHTRPLGYDSIGINFVSSLDLYSIVLNKNEKKTVESSIIPALIYF